MQLGSCTAVAVVLDSSYSSDLTLNLGTSICPGCGQKKKKKKKKKSWVRNMKITILSYPTIKLLTNSNTTNILKAARDKDISHWGKILREAADFFFFSRNNASNKPQSNIFKENKSGWILYPEKISFQLKVK